MAGRQFLAPLGDELRQAARDPRVAFEPGHALDTGAATGTTNPAQLHLQPHRHVQYLQIPYRPPCCIVRLHASHATTRTHHGHGGVSSQADPDAVRARIEILYAETFPEREVEIIILHESGGLS